MKSLISIKRPTAALLLLLFLLLLGAELDFTHAQNGSPNQSEQKLSSRLQLLAQPAIAVQNATTQAQTLSLPVAGPGSLLRSKRGEILVYIRLTQVTAAHLQALTNAGAKILHVADEYRTVTAYVAPGQLRAMANVTGVENIQEELTPLVLGTGFPNQKVLSSSLARPPAQANCPSAVTSEGDIQLNVAAARATFELDGTGITVGVLSDSYNNPAKAVPTTATADVASGDLPGPDNPCGRTTPVNVIKEGPAETDEGRAMLQIVHDLAPGVNLAFASGFFGQFDFADQIRALRNTAGTDIIVDDILYFAEPFFQDGPVNQAITEVTAGGAVYFTVAGNSHTEDTGGNAIGSYEAPAYRPTSCPLALGLLGDCHDFDSSEATDNTYSFTLEPGGSLILDLQWAEPWQGVETDLNIYLLSGSNSILASSADVNPGGTEIPAEFFSYTNNAATMQTVQLVINRADGTNTPRLKYIMIRSQGLSAEYNATNSTDIFGPAVFGHSGAGEAITVAALPFFDDDTPEAFSSRGFPTIYFGPVIGSSPAEPLSSPQIRQKPDISATNRNRNTFFGPFTAGANRFFGTSAAAPHAAAVAALMQQQAARQGLSISWSGIESILETTAAPMAFGFPEASGAGRIDALAAISSFATMPTPTPPAETPTPTPTPQPDHITLALNGPASIEPGETISLTVEAQDVGGLGLYGVQFDLIYDPALMTADNLQANPNLNFVVNASANNELGRIRLVASRRGNVPGLTGNVSLLTFEATAATGSGTATFTFDNEKIGDPRAQAFQINSQSYVVSIGDAPTSTPTLEPTPAPTNTPTSTPTPQPTATTEPTEEPTPKPTLTTVSGQVILTGRVGNNWSGATVTIDDSGQSAITNVSGNFSLTNVTPGPHTSITATAPGYLSARCSALSITAPETILASVTLLSGDTNGDDVIDITDATAVGLGFGATGPNLPPQSDINQDNVIDIFDIILVSVNFGSVGPQTWACQ